MRPYARVILTLLLLLTVLAARDALMLSSSVSIIQASPVIHQQSQSATPYMTVFKIQANSTAATPYVLSPSGSKTVRVVASKFGTPFRSLLVNFTAGAPLRVVLNTTASIGSIAVDGQGRVWFASDQGLGYYDPLTGRAQNVTALQGQLLWFIAIDTANRVWATLGSNKIAMYDPSSKQNSSYPVPTPGAVLQGITVAPDGMIWFTEVASRKLARLDPNTSKITEYSSPLKLNAPIHVAVDNTGVVWFTDHGSNEFGSFNPKTGEWRKYPMGYCPGLACSVGLPNVIFLDQNGKVWFSEHIPGRIAEYDPVSLVLTEYIIPVPVGTSNQGFAYAWWASPGPRNLVWFTAFGYGEIGYVNSSIPVNFAVSTEKEITVERGLTTQLTVTIDHQVQGSVSVGVNPSYLDSSGGQPSISGSLMESIPVGSSPAKATIGITAAWNTQDGSRVVMVTASDGQVAVSVPINVNIVEPILIYLSIADASSLVATAIVLYVRRGRRRGVSLPTAAQSQRKRLLHEAGECQKSEALSGCTLNYRGKAKVNCSAMKKLVFPWTLRYVPIAGQQSRKRT